MSAVSHEHEGGSIEGGFIYCSHEGCTARAPITDDLAAVWIWTEEPVSLEFDAGRVDLCSARLVSVDKTFACELDSGHEDEQHRGHPYPPADGVDESPTFWTDDAVGAVPPERKDESPQKEPAGASGPQDAPEGALEADGDAITQTAPIFPAEMVLTSSGWWIQRLPDGGRQLKIVALQMTAQGPRPVMPAYVLEFATAEAWDAFKELIDRDGAPKPAKPQVLTATHLPPGMMKR